MSDAQQRIDELVKSNEILLFMKGTASFPQCGFPVAHPDPQGLRRGHQDHQDRKRSGRRRDPPRHQGVQQLAHHSQLYIKGEFIGGSDIMMEMYESGELVQVIGTQAN